MTTPIDSDPRVLAAETLARARDHLLGLQSAEGWWQGELETNVSIEAEDIFLRKYLGVLTPEELRQTANWIRAKQRADGTWANFYGGPGELSTTVEAYAALRFAGDAADAEPMQRASEWVRSNGGLEATRVFTRMWLALFGWWSWDDLPALPPELIFLPSWFPLNIYDFACWARQTIVALTVVRAYRPAKPSPFGLDELRSGKPPAVERSLFTWRGRFTWLDRALRIYERRPFRPLRAAALRRAAEWIAQRQEADGSWGGIQPPWVYSILALHARGRSLDDPAIVRALQGLDGFTIVENDTRRLEACQSPVWDTALAVIALSDAGLPSEHPALLNATNWLLAEEVRVSGDWQVRRPDLSPGGWAFEFANHNYPDIDDTAEVALALRRPVLRDDTRRDAAVRRAVRWTMGMRSADGGWGSFDADNTNTLCRQPPFCDFGEVIDPPSADVTAHVLEMLAAEDQLDTREAREGMLWLLRAQEPDGSWFGRWGANYVYGLGAALPALIAAGVGSDDPAVRRGVRWLEQHQNPDGGWGEDLRSYRDPNWRGRGESTASQTAWALLALLAAGETADAVRRGVRFLAATQRADGSWDEPWYTGTGFPGDFYVNYHLYRLIFPVMALGRYVHGWWLGDRAARGAMAASAAQLDSGRDSS